MNSKSNYIVLARKYRPKRLSDLIGQEEICNIIQGSVKLNRIAHAFLFSGTRGVGKTSIARILAKIVNCISNDSLIDPCGKCSSCVSIDKESNIDVVEIDAASRTGVSDVREIIENVNYKPVSAKKKIYIIDEVHMLSKAAFNALLKTLEEPPLDVIFIFATTETEKVPVTILSRCQRFEMRRVGLNLISKRLIEISKNEGFDLDLESANLVAQCSEGSVRDALSILDNVLVRDKEINISIVREVLGLSDNNQVLDLFESLCDGDVKLSIKKFEELYGKGISLDLLAKSLMSLCYHLSRIKSDIDVSNLFLDTKSMERIKEIAEKHEMDFIVRFWELLQKYSREISNVFDEKQCFEMIIMRLCYVSLIPTPFEVIDEGTSELDQDVGLTKEEIIPPNLEKKSNHQNYTEDSVRDNLAKKRVRDEDKTIDTKISNSNNLESFLNLVNLVEKNSDMLIAYHLKNSFKLVNFFKPNDNKKVGIIELENISKELENKKILWKASQILQKLTKFRWIISISNKRGLKSLVEYEVELQKQEIESLKKDGLIKKILEIIPSSEVISIKKLNKKKNNRK